MNEAKRLLEQATPLPWSEPHPPTIEAATIRHIIREHGGGPQIANTILGEDAALIVYAVNRLPDYEAAVEALERLTTEAAEMDDGIDAYYAEAITVARAALARLRESVPALVQ